MDYLYQEFMSKNFLKISLPILFGVIFPQVKILIFLYAIKEVRVYLDDSGFHIYRIPKKLYPLFISFCTNYFFWQFGVTFGVSFLLARKIELEWFTFLSIVYNLIVYQIILLGQWKTDPVMGIIFVTILQHFDGVPILNALIDNAVAVYYSPIVFIPERIAFYATCAGFDYFRKRT
jgi:hypothetical protein